MRRNGAMWRLGCPSDSEWADLAANLIDSRKADRLLGHAAGCRSCATTLRETIALLREDEAAANAEEPAVEYEARIPAMARWTAERARQRASVPGALDRVPALPLNLRIAGASAAVAAIALVVVLSQTKPPLSDLAAAYSAQRTIELRIPGASYAPLRVNRSIRPAEMPPELLESQAKIQRHLERTPGDAGWLHAWGRTQVLTWQSDAAIQTFQTAAAAGANSPDFWVDFATAYFQRAEDRRNPADYSKAVELLDRALRYRSRDPAALCNRAVVYERLSRPDAAIRDLQLCIEAETDKEWKEEAGRLLEQMRQRIQSSG